VRDSDQPVWQWALQTGQLNTDLPSQPHTPAGAGISAEKVVLSFVQPTMSFLAGQLLQSIEALFSVTVVNIMKNVLRGTPIFAMPCLAGVAMYAAQYALGCVIFQFKRDTAGYGSIYCGLRDDFQYADQDDAGPTKATYTIQRTGQLAQKVAVNTVLEVAMVPSQLYNFVSFWRE
jgi:hypothetical protein